MRDGQIVSLPSTAQVENVGVEPEAFFQSSLFAASVR